MKKILSYFKHSILVSIVIFSGILSCEELEDEVTNSLIISIPKQNFISFPVKNYLETTTCTIEISNTPTNYSQSDTL